jgi:serine/threonine protein kinase
MGVTLYECINGKTFDEGKNMAEVYRQMRKQPLLYRVQASEKIRTIIKWCLQLDPKARPTCQKLLDFLTNSSKQIIASSPRNQNPLKATLSPRHSATSVRNTAQSLRVSFTPI